MQLRRCYTAAREVPIARTVLSAVVVLAGATLLALAAAGLIVMFHSLNITLQSEHVYVELSEAPGLLQVEVSDAPIISSWCVSRRYCLHWVIACGVAGLLAICVANRMQRPEFRTSLFWIPCIVSLLATGSSVAVCRWLGDLCRTMYLGVVDVEWWHDPVYPDVPTGYTGPVGMIMAFTISRLTVPGGVVVVLILGIHTAMLLREVWRHRHPGGNICGVCGYCLYGNVSGRCPECGTAVARLGSSSAEKAQPPT